MKNLFLPIIVLIFVTTVYGLIDPATCAAQEEVASEAEVLHQQQEQMLSTPDLVTPDSIYITTELKALYYQNLQIIELLKEIRGLLQIQQETSSDE